MKKPIVTFSPADEANFPYFQMMEKTLRKFYSPEELPLIRFDNPNPMDKDFWYRATPVLAKQLLEEYEIVIKIDSDSLILGKFDEAWEGEFDIACVNNSNPREPQIGLQGIHPLEYLNAGFVIMKSPTFVNAWYNLCHSQRFQQFQFREQDIMNLMCYFGNYTVKLLDSGDSFYGLAAKGWYPYCKISNNEVILLKEDREWPQQGDKKIKIFHAAGGNIPNKLNYRIHFTDEVQTYIEGLLK